jgi:hypothetical protein
LACDNNRLLLLASIQSIENLSGLFCFGSSGESAPRIKFLTLLPPIPIAPVTPGTAVVRVTGGKLLALIGTDYAATERGTALTRAPIDTENGTD